MPPELATYYLTQGVLGASVLVLGIVVGVLYKDNKRLEKEKIDQLEARRIESVATTKEVVEVLRDNSQSNLILAEKIEISKSVARRRT